MVNHYETVLTPSNYCYYANTCDANAVDIGATVYHKYPNGTERSKANSLKLLSNIQRNYYQIESETVSII